MISTNVCIFYEAPVDDEKDVSVLVSDQSVCIFWCAFESECCFQFIIHLTLFGFDVGDLFWNACSNDGWNEGR